MTMVRGVRIVASPCCGAQYALPNYMSMNFSAFAFWTDGWRDGSLMPNDEGLRRCQCGQFVLLKNLVEVSTADDSTLPSLGHVSTEQLPECIASAASDEVELAARIMVWHHLNGFVAQTATAHPVGLRHEFEHRQAPTPLPHHQLETIQRCTQGTWVTDHVV
ncbi:hypothetical protein [Comamonas aquatica]|uniref:hypothetical protein n=1 Tax=Comamonas aquatica TaxID=225991 RepID=UPI001B37802B|nr:hypothetical protein [Comamonas aquatica]QTX21552.1 hypothetical protein KAQ61_03335 [Comamonas aquatica]